MRATMSARLVRKVVEQRDGIGVVRGVVAASCAISLVCLAFAAPALGMGEPSLVRNIGPGSANGEIFSLAEFEDRLYFSANDGTGITGRELWVSDGTEVGTTLFKDINLGPGSSFPIGMTDAFGELIFRADDGVQGTEPWASDGTAGGTAMVTDVNLGPDGSSPDTLTLAETRTYFRATDGTDYGLWVYEGAPGETTLVKNFGSEWPGVQGPMVTVGDTVYFGGDDGDGLKLWKSDGTADGTDPVSDDLFNDLTPLVWVGGKLYFAGATGPAGSELWVYDSVEGTTTMLKDIVPGPTWGLPLFVSAAEVGGTVLFTASPGSGTELWKTDGTPAGTVEVEDGVGMIGALTVINEVAYFAGGDGTSGVELWRSNGTAAGTRIVEDIDGGLDSSMPEQLTAIDDLLFFSGNDGVHGYEPWVSDGTKAGTKMIGDINEGDAESSSPEQFTRVGDAVFFVAESEATGRELWTLGFPMPVGDAATVLEDAAATTIDVLGNDANPGGDTLSITSVTQPANGTVVVTGGGTGLTYRPDADYCNDGDPTDDFTYTLSPGDATATVEVTVSCVDDQPTAVADTATVSEDAGPTAIRVFDNDTDLDDGPISVGSVTQPANGTVTITGGGTGLTYRPDANYCNGGPLTDGFAYSLSPGGDVATVEMTVTCVDDPPVAVDDSATVVEDAAATAIAVLANDTDVDGGAPKSVVSVTQPAHGTVTITGGGAGLTYRPDADYCNDGMPADVFTYALSPGGETATVAAKVSCVADPGTAIAGRAAKVEKGVARLRLRCRGEGRCKGRATLAVQARRGKRTVRVVLGAKRFSIAAGKSKTLRIRLNRAGRTRLAEAPSSRLRVKLRGGGVKPRAVVLKKAD
jgi:ELWxxDGT repeat protein